ncbi:MAG: hypothetical protein ACI9CF_001094 [Candidatus Omnitrophota bacterium]|jgi:hypothetical protein
MYKLANPLMRSMSVFVIMSVLAGCAGRAANLVTVHQYGDNTKSCAALESEMQFAQEEINRLIPKTNKTGKNVALGVAGWFLIVPWFFMDLSKAEQEEINALRQRYNHLVILANEKTCSENLDQIPSFKDKKAFEAYQEKQQEIVVVQESE